MWIQSSPTETLPRERGFRGGLATERAAGGLDPSAPSPRLPFSTSYSHPLLCFLSSLVGEDSLYTVPAPLHPRKPRFLTPIGPAPLRFLQMRALFGRQKPAPSVGLGLRELFRACVRAPGAGAWLYTEAFQGQLRLGSQTVLLGSLGGHVAIRSTLRDVCARSQPEK